MISLRQSDCLLLLGSPVLNSFRYRNFLTSMSCFPVWRLARHVHNSHANVQDHIASLQGDPDRWSRGLEKGEPKKPNIGCEVSDYIELLCEEKVCSRLASSSSTVNYTFIKVLPPLMNLQHVRNTIWQNGGDMKILYRWKPDKAPIE